MLIQSVSGPDGAPGMQVGRPRNDSPQDLVGAFRSTLLDDSPYTGAIIRAIEHFEVPEGAEIALIGHSAGGAAIMNVAQNAEFCRRYKVTHVVAVGSPIDFKTPADPRTWVFSITNRHDLIPSLDGQGAGNCFDLHPEGWHNWHHADPTCAWHGVLKGQPDPSARLIHFFERLGWVHDVHWPDPRRIAARRAE